MAAFKLLVNAIAGGGKTSLLSSLGDETFVVSRDGKDFSLPIPHMLVDNYTNMSTFLYGDEKSEREGVVQKIEAYHSRFGKYPENIVFDSVSQITMDVIEVASMTPNVYGSQGTEITKELALLTNFIHEELEINDMNIIMLNHVIEEKIEGKKTGVYLPFGQGKFLSKGAFYATANESVTIVIEKDQRAVYLRGADKQARTNLKDVPSKMWLENTDPGAASKRLKEGEEYFTLANHMKMLKENQASVKKWSL